jgi:RimJ/RimL family protein N-acetyltransferase
MITLPLAEAGYHHWVGRSRDTTAAAYAEALREHVPEMAGLQPLVDGFGVKRAAECMLPSEPGDLSLRPAESNDSLQFFEWRVDPGAREMSFSDEAIPWSSHVVWFEHKLMDADSELRVLECHGLPAGQVRIDFEKNRALLSFSLDPVVRGRGWGSWIVAEALSQSERARSADLYAETKPINLASRRIFAKLGWSEVPSSDEKITFRAP